MKFIDKLGWGLTASIAALAGFYITNDILYSPKISQLNQPQFYQYENGVYRFEEEKSDGKLGTTGYEVWMDGDFNEEHVYIFRKNYSVFYNCGNIGSNCNGLVNRISIILDRGIGFDEKEVVVERKRDYKYNKGLFKKADRDFTKTRERFKKDLQSYIKK